VRLSHRADPSRSVRTGRRALVAVAAAVTLLPLGAGAASAQSFIDPANPCTIPAPPAPFVDRDKIDPVHVQNVDCLFAQGITKGTADGTMYNPGATVSRSQMASFIVRTLKAGGYQLPSPTDQGFTDVGDNADNINILAQLGITKGTTETTFSPRQPVRRDQMASFVVRTANYAYQPVDGASVDGADDLAAATVGPFPFTDVAPSNVHRANIEAAVELLGVSEGVTEDTYNPNGDTRRDQMATFLVRLLDVTALPEAAALPVTDRS